MNHSLPNLNHLRLCRTSNKVTLNILKEPRTSIVFNDVNGEGNHYHILCQYEWNSFFDGQLTLSSFLENQKYRRDVFQQSCLTMMPPERT